MPCKSFKCRTCGKRVAVGPDGLMATIRRHYKRSHPRKFREMIEKSVRARKSKRR